MTSVTNSSVKSDNISIKSTAFDSLSKITSNYKSTHDLSHTNWKLPSRVFKNIAKLAAVTAQEKKPKSSQTKEANNVVEGVTIEGYETLTAKQKQNLQKQLKTYQDKIKASIKDGSFDKFIEMAFGRKVDNPAELAALKQAVKDGNWDKVIPKIKIGDQNSFNTARTSSGQKVDAMGAFIKGSEDNGGMGTIILNKELLNGPVTRNGQTINFQDILTEEIGHSWDVRLNKEDSKGDEGEALSILFKMTKVNRENFLKAVNTMQGQGANVNHLLEADKLINADVKKAFEAVKTALAENDSGKMTITNDDGTTSEIDVEFGWLKKAFNKIKSVVRKVVKETVKFYTMPLRIMADILPEGNMFESAVDIIDDVTDAALDEMERLADKAYEQADKAWKKFEKNVLQSKWLGPVLMVMSFIPVLGTIAMVARLALAAYQVGKGLETGNMKLALAGAVSAVAGASAGGLISGATATTAATTLQTGYAVYNGVEAAKKGDYLSAASSFATAAGTSGIADTSTVNSIQQGVRLASAGKAAKDGEYTRAVQLGINYAANDTDTEKDAENNTDYDISNNDTLKAINAVITVTNKKSSDTDKARAFNNLFVQTGMYEDDTGKIINSTANIIDTVSGKDNDPDKIAEVSRQLFNAGIINESTQNKVIDATDFYTSVESGDASRAGDIAERNGFIKSETNQDIQYYANLYDNLSGNGDEIIEQLTSEDSTLLDPETKKTVTNSYALYKAGNDAYSTVTEGSNAEKVELATTSVSNSGLANNDLNNYLQLTADYYAAYEKDGWQGILEETNDSSENEDNGKLYYT